MSTALNRILRHQVGKASEPQSLVCDDAGWVPIDDVLQCEAHLEARKIRWPHTFLVPLGKDKIKENWDEQEAHTGCRHSSRSCSTVRGMVDVFVNKCSRSVSFLTSIETVKHVGVTVYRPH